MADLKYTAALDVTQAIKPLQQLQAQIKTTAGAFDGLKSAMAGLAIGAFAINALKSADAMADLGKAVGMSTALIKFSQGLAGAVDGSGELQSAFYEVGVTLDDLQRLSEKDLLKKTLDGLARVEGASQRVRLQTQLFGKGFGSVDVGGLAGQLQAQVAASQGAARASEAAGEAFDNMDIAINKLRDSFVIALGPLSKFIGGLDVERFSAIIDILGKLAVALLALKGFQIASDGLKTLNGVMTKASKDAGGLGKTFEILGYQAGRVRDSFKQGTGWTDLSEKTIPALGKRLSYLRDGFAGLAIKVASVISILSLASDAFKSVTGEEAPRDVLALAGIWALLGTRIAAVSAAIYGINEAFSQLTSVDPIDSMARGLESIMKEYAPGVHKAITGVGSALGMADVNARSLARDMAGVSDIARMVAAEESEIAEGAIAAGVAAGKMSDAQRQALDSLSKQRVEIENIVRNYSEQLAISRDRYTLETSLIGRSEQYGATQRQVYESAIEFQKQLNVLIQKQQEIQATGTQLQKDTLLPVIKKQIDDLTQSFQNQVAGIGALTQARSRAEAANQLQLTSTQRQIEVESQLNQIRDETAKLRLPEIERKYLDVSSAARASAEASIAAEEARRKEKLNPEERKAYYDVALKGIESLKSAQLELNRAQEAYNLQQFGTQARINSENELIKIQDEIAKSTLPAIEQKYYDIGAAARASAKAAIDAEEQRRNAALSPEEATAYYDAALKGTEKLAQATRLQYESSRSFSTGWTQAFNEYADNATNAATQAKNIFQTMTQGMEDLLVKFAKTGKFEWKNFLASMLEALLKAQIQSLFAKILGVGGAGGSGSILGQISGGGAGLLGGLGGLLGGGAGGGAGGFGGLGGSAAGALGGFGGMGGMGGGWSDQQAQDFMGDYGPVAEAFPVMDMPTYDPYNGYDEFGDSGFGGGFDPYSGYDEFGDSGFGTGYGYGEEDFGGYFARGGRLGAGKWGIAGESGPEMISGPATITPMEGLGTTVTYNINAVDANSFKQLLAQDPTFLYAVTEQGRKSLPGAR